MDVLISDFRIFYPIRSKLFQKSREIRLKIRIINYLLDEAVVEFLFTQDQFHFTIHQLFVFLIFNGFQKMQKSLNKIFGQILSQSFLALDPCLPMERFFENVNSFACASIISLGGLLAKLVCILDGYYLIVELYCCQLF